MSNKIVTTLTTIASLSEGVKIQVATGRNPNESTKTDFSTYYVVEDIDSEAGPVPSLLTSIRLKKLKENGETDASDPSGAPPEAVIISLIKYFEHKDFLAKDKRNALTIQSLQAALDWMNS